MRIGIPISPPAMVVLLLLCTPCQNSVDLISSAGHQELTKRNFLCNELFCSRIICPAVNECTQGEVVPNATICGCCEKCITYLGENEPCREQNREPYAEKGAKCKEGLECINGLCTRKIRSSCEATLERRKILRDESDDTNIYSKQLWIPECDEAGRFKPKQCKEKKCMCVDEDGSYLFGQEERELAENMTCGCSRAMAKLKKMNEQQWMIRTQEHCTHTGDYDELQCIDDVCFCSDHVTGEVTGRITKQSFIHLLSCYEEENSYRYEKQCELQLARTRSLYYQFYRKNINIVGLEHVRCDIDGTFSAKQCQPDRCACTDRKGTSMKSYYVDKKETKREMLMKCNCARDEHDTEAIHARYSRLRCDSDGNFALTQCFNLDECYCVDEDGDIITKKLTGKMLDDVKCHNLLERLITEQTVTSTTNSPNDYSDDYYY